MARLALATDAGRGWKRHGGLLDAKPSFALGFLTGQEMDWLTGYAHPQGRACPTSTVTVSSGYSPRLAETTSREALRPLHSCGRSGRCQILANQLVVMTEPLVRVLPEPIIHLASRKW